MDRWDFERFEKFEEQVQRAGELFAAAHGNAYRPEMLAILQAAETALEDARRQIGLNADRAEPQPWWTDWKVRHRS